MAYNTAFPVWMKHSFTELEAGYKFVFDLPVKDIAFEFASIYQDDKIGDFTVKLADGTTLNAIDFDLTTSYAPTSTIWTPQPNNTNNFTGNFSKFTGAPFVSGIPYFKTTVANTGATQSWGIVNLKNIPGANTVGIAEVSFRILGGTTTSGTGGLAIYTSCLSYLDTDNDGIPNRTDLDSDGDEIKDEWENDLNYGGLPDCDHDGVDNRIDPDACDPVAFQGISPNGDGKNDYLVIPGVMRTTPNTLTVLDRGGNVVYEAKDYGNNWGGDTNRGNPLLAGDGLLPDGVYFYILDYNGVRPTVSTYIYINRLKK